MQSEYANSDRSFFDSRIRWPKSPDFSPKSDDLDHEIFKPIFGIVSEFKMLSTTANRSRRSMAWIVTQGDSDVALRPTRSRRAAGPSVAKLQSGGAGSDLDVKRSALGAHFSVDMYS